MSESHDFLKWLDEAAYEARERIARLYQEGLVLISASGVDSHSGLLPGMTTGATDSHVPGGTQARDVTQEGTSA
ncbi:hypothetical protein SAMN04488074_1048 [Lentzea albidocapillata subsp. violacea]|uniref:Uncharacterized protein n=1 Tax=Lentzea albidocapillata subsp. violacea TaxID=128104 RepID=A0A1G8YCX3_9PSEU|nr:hypothetical protein [Lentzea albidocapillata]SDK00523.1 hypothetical protein SAMN04488074_1048 [Lentzea albidocapillata subsp. violacea]